VPKHARTRGRYTGRGRENRANTCCQYGQRIDAQRHSKRRKKLVQLSRAKDSPIAYFDDFDHGAIGVVGAKIAFANKRFVENLHHLKDDDIEDLFAANKPILPSEFSKKKRNKPELRGPKVPVQMNDHLVVARLGSRPSNFLVIKSQTGVVILEVVSIRGDKSEIKLKCHPRK